MKIVRCILCGQWIGREDGLNDPQQCPHCGRSNVLMELYSNNILNDDELEVLWKLFDDIPINDRDEIKEQYLDFPTGTNRFDIWHWFDKTHSKGVAYLLNLE